MRTESNAEKNIPPGLKIHAPWRILNVTALPNYFLDVTFVDGLRGLVDLSRLILSDNAGVFSTLRPMDMFEQVSVILGAVTWPGEIDLAPDAMYDAISAKGVWVI
jgi:hypothetical protein